MRTSAHDPFQSVILVIGRIRVSWGECPVWHQLLCLGARVAGLLFALLGGAILAQALITAFVLLFGEGRLLPGQASVRILARVQGQSRGASIPPRI